MELSKQEILNKIDSIYHEDLENGLFQINEIFSNKIISSNRIDIAFKLFYISYKNNSLYAKKLYLDHIRAFSLGKYTERGNPDKNSPEKFVEEFDKIIESINTNGFDTDISIIPLTTKGTLIDGSHRVSSAITFNSKVKCIELDRDEPMYNYDFFLDRKVKRYHLESSIIEMIRAIEGFHIVFLWPSAKGNIKEVEGKLKDIYYKKEVKLTYNGAHNLLSQIYNDEDWVGAINNNYYGVKNKLTECFKSFSAFNIYLIKSESLDRVVELKEDIRTLFNIGKHSIHITDTYKEAVELSELVFNDNGLHFLNRATPNKHIDIHKSIEEIKNKFTNSSINKSDAVISGDIVLRLFGINASNDYKYQVIDNESDSKRNDLIIDPNNYFVFNGLKFNSIKNTYDNLVVNKEFVLAIKTRKLISSSILYIVEYISQIVSYKKVIFRQWAIKILSKYGLFDFMSKVYNLIRK